MKKFIAVALYPVLLLSVLACNVATNEKPKETTPVTTKQDIYHEISGTVGKGETCFDIFKKLKLDLNDLFKIKEAAASVHKLRYLRPGHKYKLTLDDKDQINSFEYSIDDDASLSITRDESGYNAEKVLVNYEKRIIHIGNTIKENLVSAIGESRENTLLAHSLSDIFAWDIDFSTDLRKGDQFKIVVEGLYLDGKFRKYGNILAAEFINNDKTFYAYRFDDNGTIGYYDEKGNSVKKAFLKAPLNFRRISSSYTNRRFHPILKTYRPHHGLDYAAPIWTPVSAVGDGKIIFAGYKGGYGRLVGIRHSNGYETYYGHLSKFGKGVKSGRKVEQGQIIGYVGQSGLATGPHLHYEIRINHKPVNPLTVKLPRGEPVPKALMVKFRQYKNQMNTQLVSITPDVFAFVGKIRDNVAKN